MNSDSSMNLFVHSYTNHAHKFLFTKFWNKQLHDVCDGTWYAVCWSLVYELHMYMMDVQLHGRLCMIPLHNSNM
jgi:hypothetical protein